MDEGRRKHLLGVYRDGLLDDVIPFWLKHCVDREHGGFVTSLDQAGRIVDTDKGVWQQARFTWLLGELCNDPRHCFDRRSELLEMATHGAKFLVDHCFDESDGRMWFQVTRDGQPLRKRRYAYSESFAAIAFGELAKATGEQQYAERARAAFRMFYEHNLQKNGEPKFTDVRPTRSIGFPMIAIGAAQQLRESIGLADAGRWIDQGIELIRDYHVKDDLACVMEVVGANGEVLDHFDGRTLNPGHAIEGAWFMMREGQYRGDRELIDLGCRMLDYMWTRGWDEEFGGMLYFVDLNGLPVQEYWHDMKFWWPHNETIIATLMAYQLTGDPKYANWHTLVHDWAYDHFPDPENGEWFGYLHRDGRISSTLKGGLWKGPFHLPRMQLTCSRILQDLEEAKKVQRTL